MVSSGGVLWDAKEIIIVSGLIGIQVTAAVFAVILNYLLSNGVDPLFIVIFNCFLTSLFILPFAFKLERRIWPANLSPTLMIQLLLISLGGIAGYQALTLLGIKKTSATISTAMPNLGPGLVFVIAACTGVEKFEMRSKFNWTKVSGTLLCVIGAMAMSFLQSPQSSVTIYNDWTLGCFYLLAAVVIQSCSNVLQVGKFITLHITTLMQAVTMADFPAPLSICSTTYFMSAVFTALLQIATEGKMNVGSHVISTISIVSIMLMMGVVVGLSAAFSAWCMNQKGPVIVSIFSPIQTVCSAIISAIVLRQVIGLGSIAGMLLMFLGLYTVLWAKKKEELYVLHPNDITEPLLP